GGQLTAGGDSPQPQRAVLACGDQPLTVRREGHAARRTSVPLEAAHLAPCPHLEQTEVRLIAVAQRELLAVGGEACAPDGSTAAPSLAASQRLGEQLARAGVPEAQRAVFAEGSEGGAVCREGEAEQAFLGAPPPQPPGADIPELHGAGAPEHTPQGSGMCRRGQQFAVRAEREAISDCVLVAHVPAVQLLLAGQTPDANCRVLGPVV